MIDLLAPLATGMGAIEDFLARGGLAPPPPADPEPPAVAQPVPVVAVVSAADYETWRRFVEST